MPEYLYALSGAGGRCICGLLSPCSVSDMSAMKISGGGHRCALVSRDDSTVFLSSCLMHTFYAIQKDNLQSIPLVLFCGDLDDTEEM